MDQLKPVLAFVKKHYFWLLCGLTVILALGIWKRATGDLSERYAKRKGDVEGLRQAMQQIVSDSNQPNELWTKSQSERTNLLRDRVLKAWTEMYELQRKNNPWPAAVGAEFLKVINLLGPDQEIPDNYRELYWYFIQKHFPEMERIINMRRPKAAAPGTVPGTPGAAMAAAAAGRAVEMEGIVQWDDSNRKAIENAFNWSARPSTIEVRLAQEDLWVYEALLRVIRATNDKFGATDFYNAPVKHISGLYIGQAASQYFVQNEKRVVDPAALQQTGASSEEGESGGNESGGDESSGGGGESADKSESGEGGSEGANPDAQLRARLLQGRYVDKNDRPLPAGRPHPFAEFKMMPVCMKLVVDQRRIPDLLAECANCSMPVLVRRVTLCPENSKPSNLNRAQQTTAGMFSFGGQNEGEEESGDTQPEESSDSQLGGGMGALSARIPGMGRNDVNVEIQGIVYIFNPPDMKKLGTGSEGATAGAAQPPSPPPAESPEKPEGAPAPAASEPSPGPAPAPQPAAEPPAPAGAPTAPGPAPSGSPPAAPATPPAVPPSAGAPAPGTPPVAPGPLGAP